MGMAGGAYKGDMERRKLALQAQQMANQNAQAQQSAELRERELDMRERQLDDANALQDREMGLRERQQGFENGLRERQLEDNLAHQDRADALAERAAEWADAILQQQLAQQSKVYGGYEQLAKQARAQQEQRQALGQSAVASVMKLAMSSGGKDPQTGKTGRGAVPMYALQALNRDMGFDGENQGFVSGGYTQNGDFYLQFAQRDPQSGQILTRPQMLKPMDQYRIMNQQQGIFNSEDRGNMAAQLRQSGFRDDEILLASGVDQTKLEQMQKLAKAQQVQDGTMKEKLSALSMLKGFIDSEDAAKIGDETLKGLKAAYANGIQGLAGQFAPRQNRQGGSSGSAGVEIAKINAASRERVANNQMRQDSIDKRDAQKTEDREERRRQFDEREKRLAGTGNGGSTNGNKSRIEQMRRLDKQYETALKMGGITEEERQGYLDQVDAERKTLFEQSEAEGEKAGLGTSDDGGTRKKVSYNDLKPGNTFTYKGRKCVKTEKGFRYLD